MKGVTFRVDADPQRDLLSLLDVLRAVGEQRVATAEWRLRLVECAGDPAAAEESQRLSDDGTQIAGVRLLQLATAGVQIIDGELDAVSDGTGELWLRIRAVDSTAWDVESDEPQVLDEILRAIPAAQPLPQ